MTDSASHAHPFRVLIIKPSSLGDIIHAFPAVDLLLSRYPDAEIDWLVHPAFADALVYCRNIRNVIIFPRRELGRASTFLPHFIRLTRSLRHHRYDLVIDFQGLMRSAVFGRLTRHRRYAGFAVPKEAPARVLYREAITTPPSCRHAVEKNLAMLGRLLNIESPAKAFPPLPPHPGAAEKAAALLHRHGVEPGSRLIGIVPGARWETKRWPESFFATAISTLAELDPAMKFILLGAPAEKAAAAEIERLTGLPDRVISLVGATGIAELTEVIRLTRAMLTNDSGPMHLAAALRIPVFALFGPTVPEKTGPWGDIHTILRADLECLGCLKRSCPRGDNRCRQMIDPRVTANAIFNLINGDQPPCSAN